MHHKKRIRDYGIEIGEMRTGPLNAITDVKGVKVGHVTLSEGDMQTGVTAILPHSGNVFKEKLIASSHVINGFGKSMGTVQLAELGTIETPIILTNTLSTGIAADTLIDYMLEQNPEIGRTTGTVNSVIGECNDMIINDIRGKFVKPEHVREALNNCDEVFEEGAVGAGTGMLCYSLKGGIGSASRIMDFEFGSYTLGVLVLTNFGILKDFIIQGNPIGQQLKQKLDEVYKEEDKGSVITIVATDLPVSERQLQRILKRTVTGLSRTGSIITTGSGEVVFGFSTATRISHDEKTKLITIPQIPEDVIDVAFRAVGEATEEAVLNSMITAHEIVGRDGNSRPALKDLFEKWNISLL